MHLQRCRCIFCKDTGGAYGYHTTKDHKDRAGSGKAGAAHEGVGTAEIDLIHALRHHPGCTQAQLAELLHADKAAIARRTKNLEAKGYLTRQDAPNDRRSQLLYPTEKAENLKSSKAEVEAAFYEYLTGVLTAEEAAAFAASLNKLYTASKTESRAGFPHFRKAAGGETTHEAHKE